MLCRNPQRVVTVVVFFYTDDPAARTLWAAENGELTILTSMLDDQPDMLQCSDEDGYTPLHRAAYNGHTDVLQVITGCTPNIASHFLLFTEMPIFREVPDFYEILMILYDLNIYFFRLKMAYFDFKKVNPDFRISSMTHWHLYLKKIC